MVPVTVTGCGRTLSSSVTESGAACVTRIKPRTQVAFVHSIEPPSISLPLDLSISSLA
jgi:hypothetical protein